MSGQPPWAHEAVHLDGWTPKGTTFDMFVRPRVEGLAEGYSFDVDPQNFQDDPTATLRNGQAVLDRAAVPPEFQWNTLFLAMLRPVRSATTNALPEIDQATGNPNIVPTGTIQVQLDGLLEGAAPYVRRFGLMQDRVIVLNIAGFDSVRVKTIRSTLPGYGINAVITSRQPTTGVFTDTLYYSEFYSANGVYRVPPGARAMTAAVAAAGFEWVQQDATGVLQVMPTAVAPGDRIITRANKFRTNLVGYRATWEISPT